VIAIVTAGVQYTATVSYVGSERALRLVCADCGQEHNVNMGDSAQILPRLADMMMVSAWLTQHTAVHHLRTAVGVDTADRLMHEGAAAANEAGRCACRFCVAPAVVAKVGGN
jgi:hypothetical protein